MARVQKGDDPEKPVKAKKKSYRQQLKENDPEKYAKYLEEQKIRSKQRREVLKQASPDDKVLQEVIAQGREKGRIRQQRRREKLAANKKKKVPMTKQMKVKLSFKKGTSPCTRRSEENHSAVKGYWRVMKQKSRDKIYACPQKHRRQKEKENERRKAAREAEVEQIREQSIKKKKKQHVKAIQEEVTHQLRHLDPKVRRNVLNRMLSTRKLRILSNGVISRATRISYKVITKAREAPIRKPRRDRLSISSKHKVQDFYKSISREMPSKRFTTKAGPAFFMQMSIESAWKLFRKENEEIPISLTRFKCLRPPRVKPLSLSHREMCLCPYCLNLKYKVVALNRVISSNNLDDSMKIADERALIDILLCDREDGKRFHRYMCIFGDCDECRDAEAAIRNHYKLLLDITPSPVISWNRWERRTGSDNKVRRVMVIKQEPVSELMAEFVEDIVRPCQGVTFPQHLFVADWQQQQSHHLKSNLPNGYVLMVMDFAKNRAVRYQDEIKSAYFSQRQMTMHPIVAYYHDPSTKKIKRESHIFFTDDLKHDYHSVHHFYQISVDTIQRITPISKVVIFTDGCSSQYKSRGPLADLSMYQLPTEHNYYGSEHGKSECDGETGVVGHAVERAIVGRQVIINDARDMVSWCRENLACDSVESGDGLFTRRFFLESNIIHEREETDVKTVTGIRKQHQAQNTGTAYKIRLRNLSCYCKGCIQGQDGQCQNGEYVKSYTDVNIKPVKPKDLTQGNIDVHETPETARDETSQDAAAETSQDTAPDEGLEDAATVDELDGNQEQKHFISERDCKNGSFWLADVKATNGSIKQYVAEVVTGEHNLSSSIWVKYWNPVTQKPGKWTPPSSDSKRYTIDISDIVASLGYPTPVQEGRAIHYTFDELEEPFNNEG